MKSPEVTKKIYIKGEHALARLMNLEKLAQEHYHGNFSEMINDCLDKTFCLDPQTGAKISGKCPTGAPRDGRHKPTKKQ